MPNDVWAYDLYWERAWAKTATVPGFEWRHGLDKAVLVLTIIALPFGAATAFTSAQSVLNIAPQWGMAIAALAVALLFRTAVTAVFAQLSFLRNLEL